MMRWRRPYLEWRRADGLVVSYHWSCPASFVLILALFDADWLSSLAAWGALMLLVTAHELGHALAARAHGAGVHWIVVNAVHGACSADAPRSRRAALRFALGGVQVQAVMAAIVFATLGVTSRAAIELPGPVSAALLVLGPVNLLVMIHNLLPIPPLDGAAALTAWRSGRHVPAGALASARELQRPATSAAVVDLALERAKRGTGE
jgi:Zn-dependent protease